MQQLATALRNAGYKSSDEIRREQSAVRYQRDVAISSLVKARRRHKRSSHLKAEVGQLVRTLRALGAF